MIIFEGYDINADPGRESWDITVEDCSAYCFDSPGCTGFVLVPNTPWEGCYLQDEDFSWDAIEKNSRRPDYISAVMCDGRLNVHDLPPGGYKYPMEGKKEKSSAIDCY